MWHRLPHGHRDAHHPSSVTDTALNELVALTRQYIDHFQSGPPTPAFVSFAARVDAPKAALAAGQEIPDDYPWYDHLPDGADA